MTKNTRPHRCHRCCRDFARLEHLQRHERSHTKEKPFRCDQCTKSFTRKDLLTRHDRLAHQQEPVSGSQPSRMDMMSPLSAIHPPAAPSTASAVMVEAAPDLETEMVDHDQTDPQGLSIPNLDISIEDFTDDFASFMDNVPMPNHVFSPTFQPLPVIFSDTEALSAPGNPQPETQIDRLGISRDGVSVSDPGSVLSTYGSRLPSLEPEDKLPRNSFPSRSHALDGRLFISVQCRERIIHKLSQFPSCTPKSYVLPSRYALSRYVTAYFHVFHAHYPFLHMPSLDTETLCVELLLAISAIGARYSREVEVGNELFHLTKAITLDGLNRRRTTPLAAHNDVDRASRTDSEDRYDTAEIIQALLLLIAVATWFKQQPAVYEALSIRSVLDSLIREDELKHRRDVPPTSWRDWVKYESLNRTKIVVFCFFNIHTIIFDMPPMMLASDLRLDLPCSENRWKASNEAIWKQAYDISASPQDFQAAVERLFAPRDEVSFSIPQSGISSLGGFALIHAVIQRIWLVRNAALPDQQDQQLYPEQISIFERALKAWATCWEFNCESSMDPLNPYGPLSFTSTALLRLAYIRINMDLGPLRSLSTWDPRLIAESLSKSPPAQRSHKLTRAALHCAHALSIPVKLGIKFVAQTQVIYWSNQHALCSLECAVLLAKWLEAVTHPNLTPPLDIAEERTLEFIVQLVAESNYKGSVEKMSAESSVLASEVVRLWATLYQSESVWEMVDLIHQSLDIFANLL